MDTEGKDLPADVASFFAVGSIDHAKLRIFKSKLAKRNIEWIWVDAGDSNAGLIRVVKRPSDDKEATLYRIRINQNHQAAVQFTTLAHELGHLFLGHLGPDKKLNVPRRRPLTLAEEELEAESVAYLTCARNGIEARSQKYLSAFVSSGTTVDGLDVYQIMRAAGQVEAVLGLTAHSRYDGAR